MVAYAAGLVKETAPNGLADLETVFANILHNLTGIAGLGVIAMFAYGAFQFLTAGNNQEKAQQAKNTFTFAFIGAGALILVWLLFLFLKEYTGVDLLKFKICIVTDTFCTN